MKHFALYLFLLFFYSVVTGQEIHVEYLNHYTKFSDFKEDLYIYNDVSVSIRDSVNLKNMDKSPKFDSPDEAIFFTNNKIHSVIIKKRNNKVIIKQYLDDIPYVISDRLPKINWEIKFSDKKNILGYECIKATGTFRGSDIIAYFTPKIKYSTGPYKFYGLDGLILEVYEADNNFNHWVATKLQFNPEKKRLDDFNYTQQAVTLKTFLDIEQAKKDEDFKKMTKNIPKDVKVTRNKIERTSIEKKYEWEQ
ncbi:GLPGLI family protein [Riemerella columbina]|uniref:GLPGLI family protein n=1 Tax=Riemerella columbina TaxID=103810 RepID=UPI00037E095D|nr:GLPGLI family protein [Riemerella columbina]